MSHKSRGKWLSGFAFLAFVASPELAAQYAKAPDVYSVTEVNNMFAEGMTMEITRDGTRAVVDQRYPPREGMPKGYHTRTFYDIPAGQSYTQDLLEPGGPCSGANFSDRNGRPALSAARGHAQGLSHAHVLRYSGRAELHSGSVGARGPVQRSQLFRRLGRPVCHDGGNQQECGQEATEGSRFGDSQRNGGHGDGNVRGGHADAG